MEYRLKNELWKDIQLSSIFLKNIENTIGKNQFFSEKYVGVKVW